MTNIYAKLTDQLITATTLPKLATGNQKTVRLCVTFDSNWNNYLGRSAIFYTDADPTPYEEILSSNGICIVPPEVLVTPCKLFITIKATNSSGEVKTSTVLTYKVSLGENSVVISAPTPTVYSQLLAKQAENSARITNLAKLTEGSTTGDAELQDIRVGTNGETYNNAGEAIREQLALEKKRVDDLLEGIIEPSGRQLLDWVYVINGKSIDIYTGEVVDSTAEYYCIDKFMVFNHTKRIFINFDTPTRAYIYFYDSTKKYLSYVYLEDTQEITNVPSSAVYIKAVFLRNSDLDDVTQRAIKVYEGNARAASTLIINDRSVTEEKCSFFIHDLLRQDEVEYNKVFNPLDGIVYSTDMDRAVTGFIAVKNIKSITTNFKFYIAYYDKNYDFIKALTDTESHGVGALVLPSYDELMYIRLIFITADATLIANYYISNCEEEFKKNGILQKSILPVEVITNWYEGKKIAVLGDSITEGNKWQSYVEQKLGCKMINNAIGGTTVTNNGVVKTYNGTEIESWMCSDDRINLLPADSDMILLFGGANDWAQNTIELGNLGDGNLVDTTFKSAYSLMLKKIINKFPTAKVVALTPINGRTSEASINEDKQFEVRNLTICDFAKAVKEVCMYFGIPCIDVHGEAGISTFNHTTYIEDIVHPNDKGGKAIACVVVNGLKRFEPIDF